MKLNLFLILAVLFTLSSCGDDDCVQADWLGTYTGTESCEGETTDATIVVTAQGTDMLSFSIESDGSTTSFDLPLDGCSTSSVEEEDEIRLELSASLDGNDLSIDSDFTVGSDSAACEYRVTK